MHRYNHNLETARSHFGEVVTTHTWEERWETLRLVREMGMEVCCGGIIGMGETLQQRAEFAVQLAELEPDEVPLNFLDPRPGTPFEGLEVTATMDALRAIAAFRLALPRTVLRYAGGRELTLGDLGTRQGVLGGINAMIVGNYLTTLGRSAQDDLDLLAELESGQGAVQDAVTHCAGCGRPADEGDHTACERRQRATDPPRYCTTCGRKLVVGAPAQLEGRVRQVRTGGDANAMIGGGLQQGR